MPSAYAKKLAKPVWKQKDDLTAYMINRKPSPRCTNCGAVDHSRSGQYSKCYCGGTYQLYGVKKGSI